MTVRKEMIRPHPFSIFLLLHGLEKDNNTRCFMQANEREKKKANGDALVHCRLIDKSGNDVDADPSI